MYFSDVFFSIWLNDIPTQLNIEIRNLPNSLLDLPFSLQPTFFQSQHRASVLAIRTLEHYLRWNQSNYVNYMDFSRQKKRHFPYYVKSPNLNDEFIFYTNILPIDIEQVSFNISINFERGTRKNLPSGSNVSYFISHTTFKAVDNDTKTCWNTGRHVRKGDFFAIDFLYIRTNLSFVLTIGHTYELQSSLDINFSLDGLWWITYPSLKGITIKLQNSTSNKRQYTIIFNSTQFNAGFHSFRYIAFNSSEISQDETFRVCDVVIMNNTNSI